MESIKNGLIEEINLELEGLKEMEIGGEEYKNTVDGVGKMADRIIKMKELDNEKIAKEKELKSENRDRYIKNGIAIGTTLLTLLAYGLTYRSSMKYEAEGVIPTTEGGRTALRNLLSFKKK